MMQESGRNYPAGSDMEVAETKVAIHKSVNKIINHDIQKIGCDRLRKDGGVFLSFKCDPLEESNMIVTLYAVNKLIEHHIHVTLLTKSVSWLDHICWRTFTKWDYLFLTIGFTLTGMDDMEPNAPTNEERINVMRKLHEMGVKTFVSLEPVISIERSLHMIIRSIIYCKEYRIGLQSPYKKDRYKRNDLINFIRNVNVLQIECNLDILWKKSVLDELKRKEIPYRMVEKTLIV